VKKTITLLAAIRDALAGTKGNHRRRSGGGYKGTVITQRWSGNSGSRPTAGLDSGDDFHYPVADEANPEIEEESEVEPFWSMLSSRWQ
jgi:hypothetical protein